MLIRLPNGNYVNPRYVTAIETRGTPDGLRDKGVGSEKLWVWTGSFDFQGDIRDRIAALLNEKEEEQC